MMTGADIMTVCLLLGHTAQDKVIMNLLH